MECESLQHNNNKQTTNISISKKEYSILILLNNDECISELKSYTIITIEEKTKLSTSKIRTGLNKFIKLGYINKGARQHRSNTFYITENGINKIKQIV